MPQPQCQYCHQPRNRFWHRCSPAVIVDAANERVALEVARRLRTEERQAAAELLVSNIAGTIGTGRDWAPTVYGEYYVRSTSIYAAVKKRANAVVRPPLLVYRRVNDTESEQVPSNHPLQTLLDRANPFWTRGDLWRGTSTYLDLWGSAFWVLEKASESSTPTGIWLFRPDRFKVLADRDNYIRGFEYQHQGAPRFYRPDEIVWFRTMNPLSEFAGLSPVAVVRLSADMGLEATRYNRDQFKNGMFVDNVAFMARETMDDAQIEDTIARLKQRYSGGERARTPIVTGDMDVRNLGISPRDMEWMASLRWSLEEVARVFEVPKILLEDLEHSTFANVDGAERIFWRNITSYLSFLESEVNEMLAPQFGPDLFVMFDLSDIEALQPNVNEVQDRLIKLVSGSILTPNEAREELGRDALGPEGDLLYMPMNMVPLGQAEEPAPIEEEMGEGRGWKRRAWSDAVLDRASDLHIRQTDQHETRFVDLQRRLFRDQRQDTVRRLRALPGRSLVSDLVTRQTPGEIFNPAAWQEYFEERGLPFTLAALTDAAEAQIAAFGLGISFDVAQPSVQNWARDRVKFWAERVNLETARLLTQEIEAGIQGGETIRELQTRVESVFQVGIDTRSERIARTEVNSASNRGALESYAQSGVVESKMWVTSIDGRERDHHREAHRQTVPMGAKFTVGGELMEHPGDGNASARNVVNCILPGNFVDARGIVAASSAFYEGAALELITKSGCKLTVTPNHPILTRQGFMPAQSIRPGKYVVSACGDKRMGSVRQNVDQMPVLIEQVFRTLNMPQLTGDMRRGPGVFDFHGDGRFMNGYVNVVGANGQLWCTCATPFLEPVHDECFCGRDITSRRLIGRGTSASFVPSALHPPQSVMGGGSQTATLGGGGVGHPGIHGFRAAPGLDAILEQATANDSTVQTESYCKGLLGLASDVAFDEIVEVRNFDFSGHVYDLQTTSQLYISNGIVVHNCRCALVPVVERRPRSAGQLAQAPEVHTALFNGHSDEAIGLLRDIKEGLDRPRTVRKEIKRDADGFPAEVIETHGNG